MDDCLFDDLAALADSSGLQEQLGNDGNPVIDNHAFPDFEDAVATSLQEEVLPPAKRLKIECDKTEMDPSSTASLQFTNNGLKVEDEKLCKVGEGHNGNNTDQQCVEKLQQWLKGETTVTGTGSEANANRIPEAKTGAELDVPVAVKCETALSNSKSEDKEDKKEENEHESGDGDGVKKRRRKAPVNPANMRKNIRDILTNDKLESETLAAQQAEIERKRRLQEIQQRAHQEMMARQIFLRQLEQNQISKGMMRKGSYPPLGHGVPVPSSYSMLKTEDSPMNLTRNDDIIIVESSSSTSSESDGDRYSNVGVNRAKSGVIAISSSEEDTTTSSSDDSDEDDDVVAVSSNPSEEEETKDEDPHNSGSHVNDNYNLPDAQGRILVNVGHPAEDPDLFLAPHLSKIVKPHQVGGIRFLYDNIIESLAGFESSSGFGCILAHSMGLGKTLQVISFVDVFLRHTAARTVLIIVPINTIQNWGSEFNMWIPLPPANSEASTSEQPAPSGSNNSEEASDSTPNVRYRTYNVTALGDSHKTNPLRAKAIGEWAENGGVLLMGYELFRIILSKKNTPKFKRGRKSTTIPLNKPSRNAITIEEEERNEKLFSEMKEYLHTPDLVICDEGHRIKNCHASTSMALKNIKTKRRVVLTGYPLQNNLIEYWCMVDFVRPNFLGTRTEFCNMFERPIQNGQCVDSTPQDIKLMRYRAHVLHSLLEGFVQRRGHSVLRTCLPQKYEHVILVRLTSIQRQLYDTFMQELTHRNAITNPIKAFSVCCKIWNHPDILFNCVKNSQTKGLEDDLDLEEAKLGSSATNITKRKRASHKNLMGQAGQSQNNSAPNLGIPLPPTSLPMNSGDHGIASLEHDMEFLPFREKPEANIIPHEWAHPCLKDYTPGLIDNGLKMVLAMHIIERSLLVGDRLLLFSQSLFTLNLIEEFLGKFPVPYSNGCKWAKNKNYFRLDGSTSSVDREKFVNEFNSNPSILLFLISTRAGSLGINLIGANRVIVFDASWNPCHDTQAVCRIYRYGQSKPCHVYRLVTDNTLEKKIYDRQINKQGMSDRVVDELSPDVTLTMKEVSNLLCLNEKDAPMQDLSGFADEYDDDVLGYICLRLGHCLTRQPFEHDSQLVDRKELKLTKTEKRLAKQSYEMDKRQTNHFGGRSTSYYGYSRSEPFNAMDGSYSGRPVANVRPMLSTTSRPMMSTAPRPSPLDILAKQGVTFRQIHLNKEVRIPQPNGQGEPIVISAGQQVMIISSPRGIFLRCPNNTLVQISNPSGMGRSSGVSDLIMQNRRFNTSTMNNRIPMQQNEAEVIDLSDDDDDIIVTASSAPAFPSSRSVIVSPGSTYTSQNTALLTGGMLMRTDPVMQQPPNPAPPTTSAPSAAAPSRSSAAYIRPLMPPCTTNNNMGGGGLSGAFGETNSISISRIFQGVAPSNPGTTAPPSQVSITPTSSLSSAHQSPSATSSNPELPTSAMDYLNTTLSTPSYNNYPSWGSGPSTWGSGGSYHQGQSSAADQVAFVSSIRDLLLPSTPSGPRLFPASTALPDLVTAPLSAQHLGALYPHVLDVANDTPSYQGNTTSTPPFNPN